jgi:hypothetical protein
MKSAMEIAACGCVSPTAIALAADAPSLNASHNLAAVRNGVTAPSDPALLATPPDALVFAHPTGPFVQVCGSSLAFL